jgi:aspartate dehydrogenase
MTAVKVGIAGLGSVGARVAEELVSGLDGYVLSAVSVRDREKAQRFLATLGAGPEVEVVDLPDLAAACDILVECIPAEAYDSAVRPAVSAGKSVVTLSCGALLNNWDLVELAHERGATILVPSGALLGLDAVQAAAQGHISSVSMVTTKPVAGLQGAPHIVDNEIDLGALVEPSRVFSGTAREASRGFPANLNVVTALALAGIGPDRTTVEVWADPHATKNGHAVVVESDAGRLEFSVQNVPTSNPRTGMLTALSVIALLKKQIATLRIGT